MEEFKALCQFLDIPFDAQFRQNVREHTTGRSDPEDLYAVERDSQSEAWKWKRALNPHTVDRVCHQTAPVWDEFYEPDSWKQ